MNKILIAMHYMELGGAESALLGLLQSVDPMRAEVDVFIYAHRGDLMHYVLNEESGVLCEECQLPRFHLLPEIEEYAMLEAPLTVALKRGKLGIVFGRLMAKYRYKRYFQTLTPGQQKNDISIFPLVSEHCMRWLPSLDYLGEYDLAISFLQPHNIVLQKVKAKKKVAWIHTDYSTVHINTQFEWGIWSNYDKIVGISEDAARSFLTVFPALEEKTIVIENILSKSFVEQRAQEGGIPQEYQYLKSGEKVILCSVGRIGRAKNYDNLPWMALGLKNRGVKFHWFVVGPGDHESIDEDCRKIGVDDCVSFIGARSNPYPYIKNCTLYIQPSRYEGKSVTVREAQVLCRPVVITDYPTAHSQVIDGVDGVISPMDNEKIAETIAALLADYERIQTIIEYLQTHDYSNVSEIEKIYNLCY